MTNDSSSSTIPPFHSLPFSAYYRTECQDKYSTSRLAYHVAYFDNECASSLQLTPCFDDDDEGGGGADSRHIKPSYDCKAFVHGHQYSRKVRCFGPWVDAAGFTNATLAEISRRMGGNNNTGIGGSGSNNSGSGTGGGFGMNNGTDNCNHQDRRLSHGNDDHTNRNRMQLSKT